MSIEWHVYVGLTLLVAAAMVVIPAVCLVRDGRRLRGRVHPSPGRR